MEPFSTLLAFVRGIHQSPVNSPHKGQWRGAVMFSLICAWINSWTNNHVAGYLRCHRAHYDVNVMRRLIETLTRNRHFIQHSYDHSAVEKNDLSIWNYMFLSKLRNWEFCQLFMVFHWGCLWWTKMHWVDSFQIWNTQIHSGNDSAPVDYLFNVMVKGQGHKLALV